MADQQPARNQIPTIGTGQGAIMADREHASEVADATRRRRGASQHSSARLSRQARQHVR